MKAKVLIVLFLFSSLVSITKLNAADTRALSEQIESARKERAALIAEQERLQAELDKITAEGKNLGAAVKSLDATKKKLASDIKVTQSRIQSANLNIQSLENSVNAAEHDITIHERAISFAIKTLSAQDSRSLVLDLVASTNFSDLWRDRSQMKELSESLKREVAELTDTKTRLTLEKEKKEEAKAQAESLQKELSGQKAVVEESQKAKERLLAETKSREAAYQQMIKDNLERQRQSEQDIENLEETLRITLDPSLFPKARHGVLDWPVLAPFVTNDFGRSNCGIYSGSDCFHNGVDFRASMGTPVIAMQDGTVRGNDNTDRQKGCYSYGRWVLIDYDNGLSSIYAHLSALVVKDGDRVKKGQVVAYSGGAPGSYGSGYSTGPHLHVGLLPTQGVTVQVFSTSRGCKQVYVPLAKGHDAYMDALAYLPSL